MDAISRVASCWPNIVLTHWPKPGPSITQGIAQSIETLAHGQLGQHEATRV